MSNTYLTRSVFRVLCIRRIDYRNKLLNTERYAQVIISHNDNGPKRFLYCSKLLLKENLNDNTETTLIVKDSFENVKQKDKETFTEMVKIFEQRDKHRRGHVEFIYAALRHMEAFGVHKDLAVYKALVDVLPKGKFIPTNIFQAEFMHYPKQQQCCIDLLEKMEDNGVMPDSEMETILINIFGRRGHPVRKYWRMMYWMPKFKNLSPWPVPNPPPDDSIELAKLAIQRITSVDLQTTVDVFQTSEVESALDNTWIVSGQSPEQKKLIEKHDRSSALYVEGCHRVWLRTESVDYFILRGEPKSPPPRHTSDPDDVSSIEVPYLTKTTKNHRFLPSSVRSVHEQDDGIILAVCATGNSSQDSLLSWIRLLEKNGNPALAEIPVLFRFRSPHNALVPFGVEENIHDSKPDPVGNIIS